MGPENAPEFNQMMIFKVMSQAKILLLIILVIHSCTKPSTQCCHRMKILILDGQLPPQWALATPHIGGKVGRRLVSSRAKCRAHASASYVGPCFPLPSVPQPSPEGLPPQPSPPVCVAEDQPGGELSHETSGPAWQEPSCILLQEDLLSCPLPSPCYPGGTMLAQR